MGKRHFKGNNRSEDRNRRKDHAEKWKNTRGDDPNKKSSYSDTVAVNRRFELFYKAQNFIEDSDWENFMKSLRTPLPACFRINPDYVFSDTLREQLLSFVGQSIEVDGVMIQAVERMAWYPNGCGYKLGTDKRNIRKMPSLQGLHKWLIQHTDNGNITRQEAVSMIPPLALDVSPQHKCLDMCAAPGSKTSQLLEVVSRSLHQRDEDSQGVVVANDADTDRAYMLVHQCKRINSPQLIVSTHLGQLFPSIARPVNPDTAATMSQRALSRFTRSGYFDRVLSDVPCSGDGTLRKNPGIWIKWSTASSITIHPLQLQIAQRGLQQLKPGGLMVYSTCSMCPYENEAVVAELLRSNQGKLELLDARQFVPLFKARPGLSSWYVLDDFIAIKREVRERQEGKRRERESKRVEKHAAHRGGGGGAEGLDIGCEGDGVKESDSAGKENSNIDTAVYAATMMTTTEGADDAVGEVTDIAVDYQQKREQEQETEEMDEEQWEEGETGGSQESRIRTHPDPHVQACLDAGFELYPSFEDVPSFITKKFRRSLFPPTDEEKEWMRLERCLRCVPHDEDTGGFFVATLRKREVDSFENLPEESAGGESPTEEPEQRPQSEEIDDIAAANAVAAIADGDIEGNADAGQVDNEGDDGSPFKRARVEATSSSSATGVAFAKTGGGGKKQQMQKGLVQFKSWDAELFLKIKAQFGFADELSLDSFFVREDFCVDVPGGVSAKSVYFMPSSVRQVLAGDKEERLKVVVAGVKVLEKKVYGNGQIEYRPIQEGAFALIPYITKRKLFVDIQDFCNLLGGGLVSFTTLSPASVASLTALAPGAVFVAYRYSPQDVVPNGFSTATAAPDTTATPTVADAKAEEEEEKGETRDQDVPAPAIPSTEKAEGPSSQPGVEDEGDDGGVGEGGGHCLYAVCWRGPTKTLNVMCSKVEVESMKHQLAALGVFRPKIAAVKRAPSVDETR